MVERVGPDFLCAGMPKAGTEWLFAQMDYHPDFWMPPIKELQYFNRAEEGGFPNPKTMDIIAATRTNRELLDRQRARTQKRPLDEKDMDFFGCAEAMHEKTLNFELYNQLFRGKGDKLSGDITPAYAGLSGELVAKINAALPNLKVIVLLREPVGRAWSHLSMLCRRGLFEEESLANVDQMMGYFKKEKIAALSFPTQVIERWSNNTPADRFRYYFFDEIVEKPDAVRASILKYVGADPDSKSGDLPADFNRKSSRRKFELTKDLKDALVAFFREEILKSAKVFGSYAEKWPGLYGL